MDLGKRSDLYFAGWHFQARLWLIGAVSLLVADGSWGGELTLVWDPVTTVPVGGYRVYYGSASGVYSQNIDAGRQTRFTLSDLKAGQHYYFVVTAYNQSRSAESTPSNEVRAIVPGSVSSGRPNPKPKPVRDPAPILSSTPVRDSTPTPAPQPVPAEPATTTASTGAAINDTATTVSATAPGPIAAFGFDEAGGRVLADATGNGNRGNLGRARRTSSGRFGRALIFDGRDSNVTVGIAQSQRPSTAMTLEAWVYPKLAGGAEPAPVAYKASGARPVFGLWANDGSGRPAVRMAAAAEAKTAGSAELPAGRWTHLAMTYDGQQHVLYADGQEVGRTAQTGPVVWPAGGLQIGADSGFGLRGLIDELRVYNRALTREEVAADAALPIQQANPPAAVLGDDSSPGEPIKLRAGQIIAVPLNTRSGGQTVTALRVFVAQGARARNLVAGLYQDRGGRPGALLTEGRLRSPSADSWNEIPVPAVALEAGRTYWLAIEATRGRLMVQRRAASAASPVALSGGNPGKAGLPENWSSDTINSGAAPRVYAVGY